MEWKCFVPGDLAKVKTVPEFSKLENKILSCFVRLLTEDFKAIRMEFHQKFYLVLISELKCIR